MTCLAAGEATTGFITQHRELLPTRLSALDTREPAAGPHCRVQTFGAVQLQIAGEHAMHDLTRIENHGQPARGGLLAA